MVTVGSSFDIEERPGLVEVRGVKQEDVAEALELLARLRSVQAEHVAENRDTLLRALMAANVSLTPPASLAQAQRLATHRDALLTTPTFTYETLQQVRNDRAESTTRTWVARRRESDQLFTVSHKGRTLIPAFQFDPAGEPRAELEPLLATLLGAGVRGWALWTWLTSPTSLLSGEIPEQVVRSAPERALRAAQRFAALPAA